MRYDPKKIEAKWQKKWFAEKTYEPDFKRAKKPFYNLMMFPYPSAEGLHVGNMYAFTGSDIYGRLKRMQGYDVFQPIGLDGFGIHSENYAIKIGAHPMKQARVSEKNFYRQLAMIGNGFAWREHLETYDPDYYRWTQWIFAAMFKAGLAYRKKQAVNWCPSCKTVLADEQVIAGKCERCGTTVIKKELEQWFFRITKYAPQLLKNLETLDWSERVKIAQREWIGESKGALIKFSLTGISGQADDKHNVEVFTTRPDTLFGATFLAISPELAKKWLDVGWQAPQKVKDFVAAELARRAKPKSDDEGEREKEGVATGVMGTNPANGEKIPVWAVNYVLGDVGTGAIMAVPAHDERDFEFAKKFDLPIRQVIASYTVVTGNDAPRSNENVVKFDAATAIIKHWEKDLYYVVDFTDTHRGFVGGHVEKGEKTQDAVRREVQEESGYINIKSVTQVLEHAYARGYKTRKSREEECHDSVFMIKLGSGAHVAITDHETKKGSWKTKEEILNDSGFVNHHKKYLEMYVFGKVFTDSGMVVSSGKFTGMDSEEAKWKITKFVHGRRVAQYHLRDWLISRQRYWAPPIPMIFCDACASAGKGERGDMPGWYAVPEKSLPVKLPFVKNFRPTGTDKSPLATVEKFYKVRCPGCRAWARRETDVSDTFLDSAWYYLRYPSVKSKKAPWDPAVSKSWLPVDMYIGGAEHSVLHLLYSRFLTMAFHDWGALDFEEPFTRFRAHGLIIKDGAKMSKSRGNVVNPDEYIRVYGADAVRMYLAFMAPFEQGGDFRDAGIRGITRFLDRAWKFIQATSDKRQATDKEIAAVLHKTIKKVTEDIENLQYNTAISALMVLLNLFEEKPEAVGGNDMKIFLKLLAPFAPHMAEELWQGMKKQETRNKKQGFLSVHHEPWPKHDPRLIAERTFELVVQVNGKMRGRVTLPVGSREADAVAAARGIATVQSYLVSEPRKVIFVPDRLVNFVL